MKKDLVIAFQIKTKEVMAVQSAPTAALSSVSLNEAGEAAEIQRIIQALKKHDNNRLRVAAELGISRMGLYKKMRRYGLLQSAATANDFWGIQTTTGIDPSLGTIPDADASLATISDSERG